jgi:glycosyltransferase A (GT-A) superfamily protein (DUF2064 family)
VIAPYRPHGPAPESETTLLVIAKPPLPGRVKTRLVPPCTPRQAAALAEAALADTLQAALAVPARRRVLVLDGEPGPWLPPGFDIIPQCGGGLDERLAGAFAAAHGPALLIGMDTPQLTPRLLTVDWQVADAVAVARLAPRTRFAAQVRELAPVLDLASSACPGGTTARERQ